MAVWLLVGGMLALQPKLSNYTLSLFEGNFVLRSRSEVQRIPVIVPATRPALVMLYRRDRNYAVWDDRGLTVRAGKYVHSTRLTEISVSPKLFTPDEIQRTVDLIHSGLGARKRIRCRARNEWVRTFSFWLGGRRARADLG